MTPGQRLLALARGVEERIDARRLFLPDGAPRFEAYRGHGNQTRAVVRGRLLRGPAPTTAHRGEHVLVALRRSLAAFNTHEVPRERLRVRLGSADVRAETDEEGYLEVTLEVHPDTAPVPGAGLWRSGAVTVDGEDTPVEVLVPPDSAGLGVISDLDDTVVETGVRDPLTMLHRTLTGSAVTRRSFPGAPELYRALAAGPDGPDGPRGPGGGERRPFFYVSSSPWNLHHFLVDFLDHHGFPRGPLFLRDLLGSRHRRARAALKRDAVEEILDLHPGLRFVLIGDSGEDDAATYAAVAGQHPDRVVAVYLHEVRHHAGGEPVDEIVASWEHPAPVLLTRDFAAMHRHATALGLVAER